MKKIFALMLLISQFAFGQDFTGGAQLPQTKEDGFYRIKLIPAVTGFLEQDCSNARILDASGAEVPYIFEEDSEHIITEFREYKILERKHTVDCCTSLIIENHLNQRVDNLLLRVSNAQVRKTASLMGSDDRKQWFALKENFSLSNFEGVDETSELRVLNFPESDYRYYRLVIDDSLSAPLNIQQVGFLADKSVDPSYTLVNPLRTIEKDSVEAKETFYSMMFSNDVWIDRIVINAGGVHYFHRKGTLYRVVSKRNRKGVVVESLEPMTFFDISSEGATPVQVPGARGRKFVVVIQNEDNPPLNVEQVEVYQLNRYLTAYLRSGVSYSLRWGNNLEAPRYDLSHFKAEIPTNAKVIEPGLLMTQESNPPQSTTLSIWRSPILIWSAIVLVIVLLGWMSMSMVKEARARKEVQ